MKKDQTLTVDEVRHIAELANLPLSTDELKRFADQLAETLTTIAILQAVDTTNKKPTDQVTGLVNVFADDDPCPSLPKENALKNAKKTAGSFIQVPAIFA